MTLKKLQAAIELAPITTRVGILKEISVSVCELEKNWVSLENIKQLTGKLNVICESNIGVDLISVFIAPDDMDLTAHLKSIEQVFTRSSVDLNQLLIAAKQSEMKFREIESSNVDESQMYPYIDASSIAWIALYQGLESKGQFNLVTDDGVCEVRTIGSLYNKTRLTYSEMANSEYVFSGIDLMSVVSIENN